MSHFDAGFVVQRRPPGSGELYWYLPEVHKSHRLLQVTAAHFRKCMREDRRINHFGYPIYYHPLGEDWIGVWPRPATDLQTWSC